MQRIMDLILGLLLLLLAGCTPSISTHPPATATTAITSELRDIDSGLLTGKPCKAPCWQNLTPGQSTLVDVNQFMGKLDTTKWPGRFTTDEPDCQHIHLSNKTEPTEPSDGVIFDIQDGKLNFITLFFPGMPRLKQVMDNFGSPEFFKAVLVVGPDGKVYIVEVYYPKRGVAFRILTTVDDTGHVTPDMSVSYIQYFSPGDLVAYLTNRYSCDYGLKDATLKAQDEITKYVQPWSGFGEVKVVEVQ